MSEFDLPDAIRTLVLARNEVRDHYRRVLHAQDHEVDLHFTLDGNLIGDIGEAIAVELFGIRLVEAKSTEGIDGYAQMVCAGSDGENAARQTARIAKGWRLKEVQPPLTICTHAQTPEEILAEKTIDETTLARCRELGAAMGAGLAMGAF